MPPKSLPYSKIVHWYSHYFFNQSSPILARAFYQENYEAGMHIHDFYELNFIIEGQGYHYFNNGCYKIGKNDIFIIPPGYWHGYYPTQSIKLYHIMLHKNFFIHYSKELNLLPAYPIMLTMEPSYGSQNNRYYLNLSDEQMNALLPQLEAVAALYSNASDDIAPMAHSLSMYILAYTCRIYKEKYICKGNEVWEHSVSRNILKCINYIQEHYGENITLDTLTELSNVSRATLFRYFIKLTGATPINYLNAFRLSKAREMLSQSDLSIAEIAVACGFYDSSHLNRFFSRAYGCTPGQHRRTLRGAAVKNSAAAQDNPPELYRRLPAALIFQNA